MMIINQVSICVWTQIICMVAQCYLPHSGFKWLNLKEIDRFRVNSVGENSSHRYILEVDLKYSNELHGLHDDYPLAKEKL